MNTNQIITLARKHLDGDSARLCLSDAIELFDKGEYAAARERALKSLSFSVGVFHTDYKRASK